MEELYDYSQHRYCINIDLDYDKITSQAMVLKGSPLEYKRNENKHRTSILYDTTTRNIIARGNKADEANENSTGLQEGVIYVRNTLSGLADIYLKSKQQSFDNTALYALLYEEAVDLLQKILDHYEQELNIVNMGFVYSLILPTSWDYKIREDLFLPLFVKAGLLHKNDVPGRLVFWSMLELKFQSIQMEIGLRKGTNINYGDQRVMCTIDYQGTYSVNLKLVSAQYPAFRLAERKLVPQLLKQAHFVVPFGLKEIRLSLIACVKKHCDTTLSSESIDDMLEILSQEDNYYYNFYFRELKELYKSAEVDENSPIFRLFDYDARQFATKRLLYYQMEEFHVRRNPVILPNEESKSCLKPIIFVNIGSNWRANNIWYAVSMDKKLLDTVFGSIQKLEKSFFASGILGKDNELRKAKFGTRVEEILPAIKHKYQDLGFRLKSYFVVAHISSKHIQLSLHQVVKLASPGEDPASIIIQDEIIDIDDVYDTLCKSIMKSLQANCRVDYCITHKSQEDMQYDFQSFEIYKNIYRNLKPCIVELFENNKSNLDMDSKIQLNINTKCGCSINIFLRDIIEVSLMSVIESMATDIVTSLTNKRLFGNYVPNFIFTFGDPFNLGQGSKIHIAYIMIMQKAIDDGVYIKEKDTKTFVLRESICRLLETFSSRRKPYMFDRFVTGTLCQVSSNTYGMRILSYYSEDLIPFTRINSDGDVKTTIAEDGSYSVFIKKGKPVSTKGLIIQINEGEHIELQILQLESSTSTVPDKYTLLHDDTPGATYEITSNDLSRYNIRTFVVEYELISNNLFIKVSRGCMGLINDYIDNPYYETINIMEPLTLAYI
ncbi:hypothetical protein INT47_000356 [Mucor saturninus]|uniref:Uncharacterized protein n=1 Tax=Mucor saturninus TaxID=64648 RepID=A0A8H7QWG4_9FUNG|nr:hypothetical protein INT47_000356 [Mucor saturninus]